MLVISVTNQSRIRAAIVVVYVNMASVSRAISQAWKYHYAAIELAIRHNYI